MSEVSIYKGSPNNFEEAYQLAQIFADSGMFDGAKGIAQAMVKVQAGSELGITPYAAMSGIHIIAGKPVLGAGLIAAKIRQSGRYDYELVASSDTKCVIKIIEIRGGNRVTIGQEEFTIEQARKAGVKNLEKFPKNMLFARCISNAAKFYCPDIFNGSVYVPEDFDVETKDVSHQDVTPKADPAPQASQTNGQAKPADAPKILKPTGKQKAAFTNLLKSPLFTDEERAKWDELLNKETTDTKKVEVWTKKVSEELANRTKGQGNPPAETGSKNANDVDAFESQKGQANSAIEDATVVDPSGEKADDDDDLPDWVKN